MPLIQIHHQFDDGHTEFVIQADVEGHEDLRDVIRDATVRHPLPSGAIWMVCTEGSSHFVMQEG